MSKSEFARLLILRASELLPDGGHRWPAKPQAAED
jgi:hypothetical protein